MSEIIIATIAIGAAGGTLFAITYHIGKRVGFNEAKEIYKR